MPEPREQCRPLELPTGETIRVRGPKPMTVQDAAALAVVVAAVRAITPPPPPEAVALHARLDAARVACGLTWRALATEAGVRASVPSRLGNGIMPDAGVRELLEAWLRENSPPTREAEMGDEDDYDYDEDEDGEVDADRLEAITRRALDNPMPGELRKQIANEIEPHTMDCEADHDDVMTAIDIAFPLIRDWLAAHPG